MHSSSPVQERCCFFKEEFATKQKPELLSKHILCLKNFNVKDLF